MYTYQEIREELLKEINELYKEESYWKKCLKCPFKGKCCIDNDIDIRDDEWEIIKEYILKNNDIYNKIYQNFINGKKCYFRTEEGCLINEIRPLNCLYTPYQVIQNQYNSYIMFHYCSINCDFEYYEEKMMITSDEKYIINVPSSDIKYLFLNYWIKNYYFNSNKCNSLLAHKRLFKLFNERKEK